jgi:hypothetical protein
MRHGCTRSTRAFIGRLVLVLGLISVSGCFQPSRAQTTANPIPLINQPLVPAAATPGAAAFTLTVNGTGFVSGAVVTWNGSPRTTTFVSSSQLTVSIVASDIAKAGTATVTVLNPGSIASQSVFFNVTNPVSAVGFALTPLNLGSCPNIVGDFNRDGKMDLVGCNGTVTTIFLSNGGGTFTASSPINNPNMSPYPPVMTADVNNDGKLDLIGVTVIDSAGMFTSGLFTWLGNGDGTFQPPNPSPPSGVLTTATFASAVAGDFNGDGKIDVAVTIPCPPTECLLSPSVRIFLGKGDGTFQTPIIYGSPFQSPVGLAIGDFNRDGKLDLIVSDNVQGRIYIMLGNGDGTFQTPQMVGSFSVSDPGFLATGDLNGDGNLDLVETGENSVTAFLGNGNGTFGTGTSLAISGTAAQPILGDFSGDGKLDLALSLRTGVALLRGNGDGTFQAPTSFNLSSDESALGVGDFDQNGQLDLAFSGGVLLQTSAQLSTFSVSFGNQNDGTTSGPQNVTLNNLASSALTIDSIAITGANSGDFAIQSNSCGTSVPAGGNCIIGITFTPSAKGARSATLAFTDAAPASPQLVALTGTGAGTAPPAVSLSPASLTFPSQRVSTTSSQMTVTVTNTGDLTLTVNGVIFQGANSEDFAQTNNCSSLIGGATCAINVTFTPGASGSRSATMLIADTAANSPQAFPLSGTGSTLTLGLAVAPGSPSSATVPAGSPASYSLAIGGGGVSGTASLTCSGAPMGAVCSVPSTTSVSADTPSTFTVNVTTTSRTLAALLLIRNHPGSWAWAMLFFGITFRPKVSRKQRTPLRFAWLMLILFAVSLCSCGGAGSANSSNPNGTPAGTYTLTVTATAGATSQPVNLTFIVK